MQQHVMTQRSQEGCVLPGMRTPARRSEGHDVEAEGSASLEQGAAAARSSPSKGEEGLRSVAFLKAKETGTALHSLMHDA